jgi:ribonuclease HI
LAKKYYVVWEGRKKGIFTTWADCKAQVDKFAGAKYKSFPTLDDAEHAFAGNAGTKASKPQALKKTHKGKTPPLSEEQIREMPFDFKIFTDGACEPNPGEAGSGIAVYESNTLAGLWYGIYEASGTNNTAELNGLNQALLIAKEKIAEDHTVAIYCDSKYSIQCVTEWAKGWAKKNWTKSGGEIKNLDLIKPMFALYQEIEDKVTIYHVNGHVGIEGNELADRMSIFAIATQEKELSLYRESLDIKEILAMRPG